MYIPRMKFFDSDDSGYETPSDEDIKGLFVEDDESNLDDEGDDSNDNDSSNDSDDSDSSDSTTDTTDTDKEEGIKGDQDQQDSDDGDQEGTDSQEQPKSYTYKYRGEEVTETPSDEDITQALSMRKDYTQKTQSLAETRKQIEQLQKATGYSLEEIVNFYSGNTQVQSNEGQQQQSTQDDQGDQPNKELAQKVAQIEDLIGRAMAVNKVQADIMELKSKEKYKDIDEKELLKRAGDRGTNDFELIADQILYEKMTTEMETYKEDTKKRIEEEFKKSEDARKKAELVDGGTNQSTTETKPDKYGKDGVEDFLKRNPDFSLID